METRPRLAALKAGLIYSGLVFGAGFLLGPVRLLFVVPYFGERAAELMETPLMLAVIVLAAKWVTRKFKVPAAVGSRLAEGLLALGLMLLCEFSIVLKLRGLTLEEYFRERDWVAGVVYYLSLAILALMPLLVGRLTEPGDTQSRPTPD